MLKKCLALCILMLCLSACSSDDSYTAYSKYKASFSYSYVMTVDPLRSALNGPGEFCRISFNYPFLKFNSLTQSKEIDVTAEAVYYQKMECLSGFIVGMANLPDVGKDGLGQVCYDLACSNCYKENAYKIDLALKENGFAYCRRCKRTYNLNNQGIIHSGERGRPLERYHIAYDNANKMSIYN